MVTAIAAYTVKRGDTVRTIAEALGVTPEELLAANPWITEWGLVEGAALSTVAGTPVRNPAPGSQPKRSQGLNEIINMDVPSAISNFLGQGVDQVFGNNLLRLSDELQAMYEGRMMRIGQNAENMGKSFLSAPNLSPEEFLAELERNGTLYAMSQMPGNTGIPEFRPAITARKVRF